MTDPEPHGHPESRRAYRARRDEANRSARTTDATTDATAAPPIPAQHVRHPRAARWVLAFVLAAGATLLVGAAAAVTVLVVEGPASDAAGPPSP
ncbi:hypothetical protein, partial [Microbacterium sp. 2FI]|uniref:hypothetical protein n=1 Tax=Microbacterium sp. 2FI TaxID=2502193 RepID=UPI001BB2453A